MSLDNISCNHSLTIYNYITILSNIPYFLIINNILTFLSILYIIIITLIMKALKCKPSA